MRCEQCGDPLHEEDQKFCTTCGAPVAGANEAATASNGPDHPDEQHETDHHLDTDDGDGDGEGDGDHEVVTVEPDDADVKVERDVDGDVEGDVEGDADEGDIDGDVDEPLVIRVLDAPDTIDDGADHGANDVGREPSIQTVEHAVPTVEHAVPTVEQPVRADGPPAQAGVVPTLPRPVLYDLAADVHPGPDGTDATLPFHLARPRLGVTVVFGAITGILGLVAMFPRVLTIRTTSTSPAFSTGDWLLADLGGNLPGAMVVALVFLLAGLIGAAYGQRWGFGLVGGCGLAIAGWSALVLGLAERPVRSALDAAARPSFETFTVTVTRDLGYAIVAAAGIAGLVAFITSAGRAGPDRRRSLNPWIAALGAVAALVAAAGPLLPEGVASIDANWTAAPGAPSALLLGRLAQLGLLAFTGVVGFLLVRRYGLGLAVGGMTVSVWLVVSALTGLGDDPIGPGYNNPGGDPFGVDLHAVTVVGSAALVLLAVAAIIAAYDLAARES